MSEAGIDVLMKIVGAGGTAYAAESYTTFSGFAVQDPLRNGFIPGQFCELQNFSFSIGARSALKTDEEKERDKEKERRKKEKAAELNKQQGSGSMTYRERQESIYRGQAEKRTARETDDDVDIKPVEFTRIVDSMSSQLFTALVGCDTLDSLTVVKRRAGGVSNSGACYLRLDFTKVLMTELAWKDSQHLMIETGTFIYRKVKLLYRPQKPDGSLDVAIQAEWEMPTKK